jgi:hypothetical protein
MAIKTEYFFSHIAPGIAQSVFIHGYGAREFISYSMIIDLADIPTIGDGRATLTVGETIDWASVDGTIGRIVTVTNTGNNSIGALILAQSEMF